MFFLYFSPRTLRMVHMYLILFSIERKINYYKRERKKKPSRLKLGGIWQTPSIGYVQCFIGKYSY
ncbi:MAG: hypothetical protein A2163_07200 [Actinobacteria bacterium RBG_13_35_12]|nr:MAG: hypothetical protein A2163_07200 [Actinobacteria bacterium RBG_13_35_12]